MTRLHWRLVSFLIIPIAIALLWVQRAASPSTDNLQLAATLTATDLQMGDLIFRQSNSFVSSYIRSLEDDAPYSHVGLVMLNDGEVSVIHARLVEGEYHGMVIQEPLVDFLKEVNAAAVYRVDATPEQDAKVMALAAEMVASQRPFDMQFDLATDDALYCTELVWKVWLDAGIDLIDGQFDQLSLPFNKGTYILPNSLSQSGKLNQIVATNATK